MCVCGGGGGGGDMKTSYPGDWDGAGYALCVCVGGGEWRPIMNPLVIEMEQGVLCVCVGGGGGGEVEMKTYSEPHDDWDGAGCAGGVGEMKTYPEPLDDCDGARCAVWLWGWGRWDVKTYPEPFNDEEGAGTCCSSMCWGVGGWRSAILNPFMTEMKQGLSRAVYVRGVGGGGGGVR